MTLGDLMKGNDYVVPDYQRDFSWGKEELEKLWNDIKRTWSRSFTNGQANSDPDGHFIGAIVTHKSASCAEAEVIDGQQRLTSFSIFISVLIEFCNNVLDANTRDNLKMQLLPLIASIYGSGRDPRLQLAREQDFYDRSVVQILSMDEREAYWSTINIDKEPVKQKIRDAVRFAYGVLSSFLEVGQPDRDRRIANLADVITELIMVLNLQVVNHRMAYVVFETLNFRGLDLSQADLLKNELVRRANQHGTRDAVVAAWSELTKNLDRATNLSLVEFLQLHFASKYAPVRASELFDSVVAHLDDSSLSPIEYTKDLVDESARLVFLVEGDNSSWSEPTNQALDDIREIFNMKFAYPLLMAASARYVNSPDQFGRWAVRARNFCFRYFIIERASLSVFEREITQAARSLRDPNNEDKSVLLALKQASNDVVFSDRFKRAVVSTNKMGFYVVKSIEDHLSGGAGTTLPQGPAQHLEHIMPRKPGPDWDFISNDPNYSSYLMRIGNLLGLEQKINGHIKNKSFSYKNTNFKELDYLHSKMSMPSQLEQYLSQNGLWDFDSIEKRQAEIATELANVVWPLE